MRANSNAAGVMIPKLGRSMLVEVLFRVRDGRSV